MNRSEIETKLHIIRAGLECAPHTSTNAAACAALIALQEALLADQPAPTETAPQGAPQSTCDALLSAMRAELAECNCPCCRGNLVLATGGVA